MQSFLCRVMVFVFLLNCLFSPAPGRAQPPEVRQSDQLSTRIEAAILPQLENKLEQAIKNLLAAETVGEISTAIINLHQLMDKNSAVIKQEKAKRQHIQSLTVSQPVSTSMPSPNDKYIFTPQPVEKNEVLVKLVTNTLSLEEMLEYIDPI